jgi:hypothetical protein
MILALSVALLLWPVPTVLLTAEPDDPPVLLADVVLAACPYLVATGVPTPITYSVRRMLAVPGSGGRTRVPGHVERDGVIPSCP